jgi:hypothetical protein
MGVEREKPQVVPHLRQIFCKVFPKFTGAGITGHEFA